MCSPGLLGQMYYTSPSLCNISGLISSWGAPKCVVPGCSARCKIRLVQSVTSLVLLRPGSPGLLGQMYYTSPSLCNISGLISSWGAPKCVVPGCSARCKIRLVQSVTSLSCFVLVVPGCSARCTIRLLHSVIIISSLVSSWGDPK